MALFKTFCFEISSEEGCGVGVETVLFRSDFEAVSSVCFHQAYGGFPSCVKGLFVALLFLILYPRRKKRQLNLLKM